MVSALKALYFSPKLNDLAPNHRSCPQKDISYIWNSDLHRKKEADFSFVFQVIKDGILDQSPTFNPTVLVGDCAKAITNASNHVFTNEIIRVYCWFHVVTNIRKQLAKLALLSYEVTLRKSYHLINSVWTPKPKQPHQKK